MTLERNGPVLVIYTGGTIGATPRSTKSKQLAGTLSAVDVFSDELRRQLSSTAGAADLEFSNPYTQLSEQLNMFHWATLAVEVDRAIAKGFVGVVIAHGTDTMAYTAAALAMMIQNPPIAIVLTGARESLDAPGSDAIHNFAHALFIARSRKLRGGVYVSFAGRSAHESLVLSGTNVRKDASRQAWFRPAIGQPVGVVSYDNPGRRLQLNLKGHPMPPFPEPYAAVIPSRSHPRIGHASSVAYFQLYPAFAPSMIRRAVSDGARGLILGAYGLGTVCTEGEYSLLDAIRSAAANCPVFVTSQHYGEVVLDRYASSRALNEMGCVGLKQMTTETAIAKLMWVLSQSDSRKEIEELMLRPIAGEL